MGVSSPHLRARSERLRSLISNRSFDRISDLSERSNSLTRPLPQTVLTDSGAFSIRFAHSTPGYIICPYGDMFFRVIRVYPRLIDLKRSGAKCFFEISWDKPKIVCNSMIHKELFVPRRRGTSVGQDGTNCDLGQKKSRGLSGS